MCHRSGALPSACPAGNATHGPDLAHVAPAPHTSEVAEALPAIVAHHNRPPQDCPASHRSEEPQHPAGPPSSRNLHRLRFAMPPALDLAAVCDTDPGSHACSGLASSKDHPFTPRSIASARRLSRPCLAPQRPHSLPRLERGARSATVVPVALGLCRRSALAAVRREGRETGWWWRWLGFPPELPHRSDCEGGGVKILSFTQEDDVDHGNVAASRPGECVTGNEPISRFYCLSNVIPLQMGERTISVYHLCT
jgi:hypothetical protein